MRHVRLCSNLTSCARTSDRSDHWALIGLTIGKIKSPIPVDPWRASTCILPPAWAYRTSMSTLSFGVTLFPSQVVSLCWFDSWKNASIFNHHVWIGELTVIQNWTFTQFDKLAVHLDIILFPTRKLHRHIAFTPWQAFVSWVFIDFAPCGLPQFMQGNPN